MLDFATAVVLLAVSFAALQTEGQLDPRAPPFFNMKMGPCKMGCAPITPLGPPPPPPPPPFILPLPVSLPPSKLPSVPQPPPLSQLPPVPQPPPLSQLPPVPQPPPHEGHILTPDPYHPPPARPEAYKSYPHCDNNGECRGGIENTNLNKVDVSPVISVTDP
ncbi:sulfated surface glycoprotein 185-like [Penaeus chinensis]|uniref:sulfated surface glycoprotein 185-like n=1 Tax=Penaeus chinensis TaxID=139456 RepID=UPI001FB571FD|nr:sulfated surface glycoprotein 185-like [Penaeus chinensis]